MSITDPESFFAGTYTLQLSPPGSPEGDATYVLGLTVQSAGTGGRPLVEEKSDPAIQNMVDTLTAAGWTIGSAIKILTGYQNVVADTGEGTA